MPRTPVNKLRAFYQPSGDGSTFARGGLDIIAAVGPFTTADNLEFRPLDDLVRVVETQKPDLVVLVSE